LAQEFRGGEFALVKHGGEEPLGAALLRAALPMVTTAAVSTPLPLVRVRR
jgi:hypothetical protein